MKHYSEHPSSTERKCGGSTETLLPLSQVLPEVSSLPSVTEVLVLLSDVEVFEDEAFFP